MSLCCVFLCSIVVLAGDTMPIDVYCHLPIMCEDKNLPYAYIPSKMVSEHRAPSLSRRFLSNPIWLTVCSPPFQDLGSSAGSKRPTCVILIKPHQDYQDAFDECVEEVSGLPKPL